MSYPSYQIHLELIQGKAGWGFTFSLGECGGSGFGGLDPLTALKKAHAAIRKEIRRMDETKEAKAARLDQAKRIAALRKSKDKGVLP